MWAWLNANAGAIQALSSVLGVAVTAILVIITARYVGLTQALAEAAHAQVKVQFAEAKARSGELGAALKRLLLALESLPGVGDQQAADRMMRTYVPIDDFDFGRFRMLASELSSEAGNAAAVVESSMKWLTDRAKEVRDTPPLTGYDWAKFDWRLWNNTILDARAELSRLAGVVSGLQAGQRTPAF